MGLFLLLGRGFTFKFGLNILDKIVDRFVIVEGNKTWQNNPKNLSLILKIPKI